MVKVRITEYGFMATGHADFDEHGYDIVCSAISALTQTIALSLEKNCKAKVDVTKNGIIVDINNPTEKSLLLLGTMKEGLINIAKEYPKHIQVEVKRGVL